MKLKVTVNGQTYEKEATQGSLRGGRNEDNELPLPVPAASRVHFKIGLLRDGGWAIRDLGSTNGTLLNGERIEETVRLKHRDEIRIGADCAILFLDPLPAPTPRKKRTGPIVVKSRAQKRAEEQEQKRRTNRDKRRAAAAEQAQVLKPKQGDPAEIVQIDSEATLDRLIKDKAAADRLLAGPKRVEFGPCTLQQRLSEGGMGYVVRARHHKLKMDVALKLLRTEKVDEQNIARFKQEAWAISAFDHPNIVKVRDMGTHAGMYYIAMDFIEGEDLLALGFKGTLTFWQVMETIDKLADVLRLVHARNIWHRDIKPQNVLMDRNGEIKLIDFGIATVEREHDAAAETGEGLIMGTPAFLSPEQAARGKLGDIDGRADLYSVGAVMYYLLTGRRPFTGKTAIEILMNNMKKPPPHPHTVDPKIPSGLVEVCLKLLQKRPSDRYQSAEELQTVLAGWRKSRDGRMEHERHKKIMKLRAMKEKRLARTPPTSPK